MIGLIKRSWSRIGAIARVAFAETIINNLKKTPPPIATPDPTVVALEALYDTAETAVNRVKDLEGQLKVAREARNTAVDALMGGIEEEAATVEKVAKGSKEVILAVGFELVDEKAPVGPMPQVTNVAVTSSDNDGAVDVTCDAVPGSSVIEVEYTYTVTDPDSTQPGEPQTRTHFSLAGLTSGKRVWLRLRARGAAGPGPWSDWASKMVP
jgi:hypothetical protein